MNENICEDVKELELKKARYEKAFYDLFSARCRRFITEAEILLKAFNYIEDNCKIELEPTYIVFPEFKKTLTEFIKEMKR